MEHPAVHSQFENKKACREAHKKAFEDKIDKIKAEQEKIYKMFSDYKPKIERMEEICWPGHKMIAKYYSVIARFKVLEVERD